MAKKLLLADDSITIQKVVELVLSEEDFQIKAVNNGQDALKQLEAFKPDIVLADIEMPQVNGYQLCERIKKNQTTSHIPVVLLAGAFEPLDDELAKNVGADGYIIKPFESQELISKVNAALTSATMEGEAVSVEVSPGQAGPLEEVAVALPGEAEGAAVAEPSSEEEDLWAMEDAEAAGTKGEEEWDLGEDVEVSEEEMAAETVTSKPGADIKSMKIETQKIPESVKPPLSPPAGKGMPAPPVKMPSEEAVISAFREEISRQVAGILQKVDAAKIVENTVSASIKNSLDPLIREALSKSVDKALKDALAGAFSTLGKQVENVIWETVPDLAENIIRKEIERIKAEV